LLHALHALHTYFAWQELLRDAESLNLGAAENYPTRAVAEAAETPITGKSRGTRGNDSHLIVLLDTEGYPGKRYHGGKHYLDDMERLCWKRALQTFDLDGDDWGVNVQGESNVCPEAFPLAHKQPSVLSGSLANVFSYIALMSPGDVVMGLQLSHGGHISHGYQTATKKISETAIRFTSISYHVDVESGLIDYEGMDKLAQQHRPRIITVGGSAYSRLIDYERVRQIADKSGSLVHCDMSHFCGLVAAKVIPSPFPYCDLVTTTATKTFRGPLGAMIFSRKWMTNMIDQTVFPRFQAGADSSSIIALAVALLQARTPESIDQQRRVVESAKVLATELLSHGYRLCGGGTDTHLILLDLRPSGVSGSRVERVLELMHIYCNRNTVPNDKVGISSGVRFGTAPMITRGMRVAQFVEIAALIHQGIQLSKALSVDASKHALERGVAEPGSFRNFLSYTGDGSAHASIVSLRAHVMSLAKQYPPPWK
jgi:glycine hydroxymethyltransferase